MLYSFAYREPDKTQSQQEVFPTNGLVLSLDAANKQSYPENAEGNFWFDVSGNNNHASLYNTTYVIDNDIPSISFENELDFSILGSFLAFENFTINICLKTKENQESSAIILDNSGNNSGFVLQQNGTSTNNYMFIAYNTNGQPFIIPNIILEPNKWLNISIVCEKNKINFYKNSQLISTLNVLTKVRYNENVLCLGQTSKQSSNLKNWNGKINCIHIYNRTLEEKEIFILNKIKKLEGN